MLKKRKKNEVWKMEYMLKKRDKERERERERKRGRGVWGRNFLSVMDFIYHKVEKISIQIVPESLGFQIEIH